MKSFLRKVVSPMHLLSASLGQGCKLFFVVLMFLLVQGYNSRAQMTLTVDWEYTFTNGLSCRYPMLIDVRINMSDGTSNEFTIFKHPNQSGTQGYPNYSSPDNYYTQYIPAGVTITSVALWAGWVNNQGKCPGLCCGYLCWEGTAYPVGYSNTDHCSWPENTYTNFCGMSNFKVRTHTVANDGSGGNPPILLSTAKPNYCPGESVTFEIPCDMKGRNVGPYKLYYKEGTAWSSTYVKDIAGETFTVGVGTGYDFNIKPGIPTYFMIQSSKSPVQYSAYTAAVRFGGFPPTASVSTTPPKCADGSDWSIDISSAASTTTAITTFKANIFHESNLTSVPDGAVSFTGTSRSITLTNMVSNRVFTPGVTKFKVVLQNDYNVTDYGVCSSDLGTYTVPNRAKLTATEIMGSHKDAVCYNTATGSAQLTVTNGDGNYSLTFNGAGKTITAGSPVNQPIIDGLLQGSYSVVLKDTYCTADAITVNIGQPALFAPTINVAKGMDCANSTDAKLEVVISGGKAPYSAAWSNGDNTLATTSVLSPGSYSVTVTDGGCPAVVLNQGLTAPPAITFTMTPTPPVCPGGDDGSMTVSNIQNAGGTISYEWSTLETSAAIFGLVKGDYTVKVISEVAGKTCYGEQTQPLNDPPAWTADVQADLVFNGEAIRCYGESNGKLSVSVKNDAGQVVNGEYYTWSTGVAGAAVKSIDQLPKGTYEVSVRYNGVCEAKDTYILQEPDQVVPVISATSNYNNQPISCYGVKDATLRATATGGPTGGAYSYAWTPQATGALLPSVGAGTYKVIATDVNGCTGDATFVLLDPDPVVADIINVSSYSGYGVSCNGLSNGSMTAEGSGGTGVYTYLWSNGKTTALNGGIAAGNYSVTVTDNNGCHISANEVITTPQVLKLAVANYKDVSCFGGTDGSITLAASGGVTDYEYTRNNGANWQPDAVFNTLPIGSYTIRLRDKNGCEQSLIQPLVQPTQLGLTFTNVDPAFCSDPRGGATAVVTGGVAGYQYSWVDATGAEVGTDVRLSNVKAGIYTAIIHDNHVCEIRRNIGITSTDGADVDYSTVSAKCHDSSDGSALLSITGDGPFIIQWPDGQSGLQGVNLKGDDYAVMVTDGHNCAVVEQVVVPAPDALKLDIQSHTPPTCNSDCDGILTLVAQGGVGSYVYDWNGRQGTSQSGLCAGTYPVVLTDANNCLLKQDVILEQPAVLEVKLSAALLATCRDGCDGRLEVLASGGNGGYTYSWDGGTTGTVLSNLCPGPYGVMVSDAKNCVGNGIIVLENTPPVPLDLGGGVTLCVGQTYDLAAGTGWSRIQWGSSTGLSSTEPSITLRDPGSYWLEVLDSKGCVGQDTFLLETSYDLLKASFMIPEEAVAGDTVVMIDISWPMPEAVEWSYPFEMSKVSGTDEVVFGRFNDAGTFQVGLTAKLGECRDYIEKSIVILEAGEDETDGRLGYEKYVKVFGVYANPNDGSFDVEVELAEQDDIMLSIWGGQTGGLVGKVKEQGKASYLVHVDLRPLSSGAYVLRLEHSRGTSYVRFIVK